MYYGHSTCTMAIGWRPKGKKTAGGKKAKKTTRGQTNLYTQRLKLFEQPGTKIKFFIQLEPKLGRAAPALFAPCNARACRSRIPCNTGELRPLDPLQYWGAAPSGTPCNTGGLHPADRLQYQGAAPPRPPAIPGGCAPQTACETGGLWSLDPLVIYFTCMVHACTTAAVRACTTAIVLACTMTIVHACTMITKESWGRSSPVSQGVQGAQPPRVLQGGPSVARGAGAARPRFAGGLGAARP